MLIVINTLDTSPIYEQLRNQIVIGIASKGLAQGEALPSVRRLAADLGINLHTVNKSYAMLCDEGYLVMDRRKGAVVAQSQESKDAFLSKLSNDLILSAAESICHGMAENTFIALCKESYLRAMGNAEKGEPQWT
jgi:GntR family transcriptional regulator